MISQIPDFLREQIVQNNFAQLKIQNKNLQNSCSPSDLSMVNHSHSNISAMSSSASGTQKYCFSRFFIIKSYSEEDVHKGMKYSIWSSTERGNKILDAAYVDIQNFKMSQ